MIMRVVDSCHHHCGAWNTIRIDGDLVSVAMQKWYEGIGIAGSKKVHMRYLKTGLTLLPSARDTLDWVGALVLDYVSELN